MTMKFNTPPTPKDIYACNECCKTVESSIRTHCGGLSDYGLKYFGIVINMCAFGSQSTESTAVITDTVRNLCVNNHYIKSKKKLLESKQSGTP